MVPFMISAIILSTKCQNQTLSSREFDPSDYGNRSILGPPFRIMDEDPTDLWGWIVNIMSATGAIVGILGIFVIIFEVMGL